MITDRLDDPTTTPTAPPVVSSRVHVPPDEIEWITREIAHCLTADTLRAMPHVRAFEADFAAFTGRRHAIAVNSGSAAVEAAYRAVGVAGGEVVVPTNTFIVTASAALHAGADVVLVDTQPGTLAPTAAAVAAAITDRTRAVALVHMGGLITPETDAIRALCDAAGVPLIEDVAQATGARLDGRLAGTFGTAAAFSFYPTKIMTTGEGGMVVTDDDAVADRVRALRDQGRLAADALSSGIAGFNWRLSEIAAIVGRSQLRTLPHILARRAEIAAQLTRELADLPLGGHTMPVPDGVRPAWYKFWLRLDPRLDRARIRDRMHRLHGIELPSGAQDVLCHEQEPTRSTAAFPAAEQFRDTHLCVPIYPDLTAETVTRITSALRAEIEAAADDVTD